MALGWWGESGPYKGLVPMGRRPEWKIRRPRAIRRAVEPRILVR